QNDLEGKLNGLQATPQAQMLLASRILLPLASTPLEREGLLAVRHHMATPQSADALRKRYEQAFKQAIAPPPPMATALPFPQAFPPQAGEPPEVFPAEILRRLPDNAAQTVKPDQFPQVYQEAFNAVRTDLTKKFTEAFTPAAATSGPQALPPRTRKAVIA